MFFLCIFTRLVEIRDRSLNMEREEEGAGEESGGGGLRGISVL